MMETVKINQLVYRRAKRIRDSESLMLVDGFEYHSSAMKNIASCRLNGKKVIYLVAK